MGGRSKNIQLIALPYANNNLTLLVIYFLEPAGIVLNLLRRTWYYINQSQTLYTCNLIQNITILARKRSAIHEPEFSWNNQDNIETTEVN